MRRGGHLLARTEVAAVLRALADQVEPDLTLMARVAAQWRPPTNFPTDLPATWLLLGEFGHANALLDDMAEYDQIAALCAMIDVARAAGASDRAPMWGERAATLAGQQVHPLDRVGGLRRVAQTIAAAGHRLRATRIVAGIENVEDRRFVELGMIDGLIQAGEVDEAVRRTFAKPFPTFTGLLLRNIGCSLARNGRIPAAERGTR